MGRTHSWGIALCALGLLAATACSDDDAGADAGAAGSAVKPTTSTTTTAASTTTTADLSGGPDWTSDGVQGEGCTVGEVDQLPEGWWIGEVTSVDGASFEFDLVCFYSGEAAEAAATEDGTEVTNDYYTRNTNPRTFTQTFADPGTSPATCNLAPNPIPCTVQDVLDLYADGTATVDGQELLPFPYVWLHITGTTPDYLYVQYTP